MSEPVLEAKSTSVADTLALGSAIAAWLKTGDVLLLHGDLGAGKTTLTKGIAAGLGVDAVVSSPSFALVNEYETGPDAAFDRLYHLDLFRLHDELELASIGFVDYLSPSDGAAVVEWPERAAGQLPDRYVLIAFSTVGVSRRHLRFTAFAADDGWGNRTADLRARLSRVSV